MKRILVAVAMVVAMPGCMSPMTSRMDLMNQQLSTATAEIAETNQRLASVQAKLDEANSRLDVVNQAILKFPGLRAAPAESPVPPATAPAPSASPRIGAPGIGMR